MESTEPNARGDVAVRWGGPLILAAVCGITLLLADRPARLVQTTIHLSLVAYCAALWLMPSMAATDWQAVTRRGCVVRALWTWACLTLLVHVGCAFHFVHGWSQARAFEQTRIESGFAAGLYVNYLFMAMWTADALWWRMKPSAYARRPGWMDVALHGFMLFIVINAVVVFEAGVVRWVGVCLTLLLALRWACVRAMRPSHT